MANEVALDEVARCLGAPAGTDAERLLALIDHERATLVERARTLPAGRLHDIFVARLRALELSRRALVRDVLLSRRPSDIVGSEAEDASLCLAVAAQTPSYAPGSDAAREPTYLPGQRLCHGRYTLQRILRRSGLGVVYSAFDSVKQAQIALVVLAPLYPQNATARARLEYEAETSIALEHERIQRVHALHREGGDWLLSMELVEGETLRERMDRRTREQGRLSVADVLDIAIQVADALAYAHARSVLHLDIRPENIVLTSGGSVKVTHFGVTRMVSAHASVRRHADMGTGSYVAPEEVHHGCRVDSRADQYALGVVLHEALTGHLPLGGGCSLRRLRPDIPWRLERVIERLLSVDPEGRYRDSGDLAQELASLHRSPGAPSRLPRLLIVSAVAVVVPMLLFVAGKHFGPPLLEVHRINHAVGEMIHVEAGTILMGAREFDEDQQHPSHRQWYAHVPKDYYLGRHPVTQAQYKAVTGVNPSHFQECGGRCPVESVSYFDAVHFTNRLNEMLGLPPCYDYLGRVIDGQTVHECRGYRLPTDVEWEYAAHAGVLNPYHGSLGSIAWYRGNSDERTHEVGGKEPNAWGFYDMIGNVQEWADAPLEMQEVGLSRVSAGWGTERYRTLRGGSFRSRAPRTGERFARYRQGDVIVTARGVPRKSTTSLTSRRDHVGFRIARSSPLPQRGAELDDDAARGTDVEEDAGCVPYACRIDETGGQCGDKVAWFPS